MDDEDATASALTKSCTRCGYGDIKQYFRFCPGCGQMVELHASEGTLEDIEAAHKNGPRQGLITQMGRHTLKEWAERAVGLSAEGLKRRGRLNAQQHSEDVYLAPLFDILKHGQSTSAQNVARYGDDMASLIQDATL
jgi:gamma-glutamylcysteine synthetase